MPSIRKTGEYKIKGVGGEAAEDEKRLFLRKQLKEHNKQLASEAKKAGVKTSLEYAIFQNEGYKGLYNELTKKDIAVKKGLKSKGSSILDYMGSTELAANFFRGYSNRREVKERRIKKQRKSQYITLFSG